MKKFLFQDSSSIFDHSSDIPTKETSNDRNPRNGKRAPPTQEPRQIVKPIHSGQFAPFTNFFISLSQAHNLLDCSNQSILLKVRVHPSIPIVETPSVWCTNREADFQAAYSFDFTQIPPFNLGDFTPVLELYKRYSKRPELVAVALLPLKVAEVVECAGTTLTFLYRNKSVILKDVVSGRKMGSLIVTVAMGFPEHQPFLDPNSQFVRTPEITSNSIVQPVNQQNLPEITQLTSVTQTTIHQRPRRGAPQTQSEPIEEEQHSRRRQHRKRKEKTYDWVDEALQLGWKPPGSTDFDWKAKAREKGWIPPSKQARSSIGIHCNPNAGGLRQTANSQTEAVQPAPDIDNDEAELISLLNPKKNKKQKKRKQVRLSLGMPSCLFDEPAKKPKPVLTRVPCLTLVSEAPLARSRIEDDLLSSSEQQELHTEIQEMLNVTHQSLANFKLSSEEDEEALSDINHQSLETSYEEEQSVSHTSEESDAGSILRKIARDDPELMKMIELMDV